MTAPVVDAPPEPSFIREALTVLAIALVIVFVVTVGLALLLRATPVDVTCVELNGLRFVKIWPRPDGCY